MQHIFHIHQLDAEAVLDGNKSLKWVDVFIILHLRIDCDFAFVLRDVDAAFGSDESQAAEFSKANTMSNDLAAPEVSIIVAASDCETEKLTPEEDFSNMDPWQVFVSDWFVCMIDENSSI